MRPPGAVHFVTFPEVALRERTSDERRKTNLSFVFEVKMNEYKVNVL